MQVHFLLLMKIIADKLVIPIAKWFTQVQCRIMYICIYIVCYIIIWYIVVYRNTLYGIPQQQLYTGIRTYIQHHLNICTVLHLSLPPHNSKSARSSFYLHMLIYMAISVALFKNSWIAYILNSYNIFLTMQLTWLYTSNHKQSEYN